MLINCALADCENLTIISYTKPEFEQCGPLAREAWLKNLFPSAEVLVIDDQSLGVLCRELALPMREIPHNDAHADIHRDFVGWLCYEVLSHTVEAVFTSEEYGDGFARLLSDYFSRHTGMPCQVTHVCVDQQRLAVPISGTVVRQDPHLHQNFLSPKVYGDFVRRVCLLGGESTGKTTLSRLLALQLSTEWVAEYGRELWERKEGRLEYEDMMKIASMQVASEVDSLRRANKWLICDTSPLTTLFYSMTLFGKASWELHHMANRQYDLVLLCSPDFPFIQDGTRQNSKFREQQHTWYLKELNKRNICFKLISGSLDERVLQALGYLNEKDNKLIKQIGDLATRTD